jgi:predicted nucleic acid-binding protein
MSNWVCLDASLVIRFILSTSRDSPLLALWEAWHQPGHVLVAPTLLYYEVSNALHRYVFHGDLSPEQAIQAMGVALEINFSLYGDADLHYRAMDMALRFQLPAAYDAHYLALAERLGAELWTVDRRLHRAVADTLTWVNIL